MPLVLEKEKALVGVRFCLATFPSPSACIRGCIPAGRSNAPRGICQIDAR